MTATKSNYKAFPVRKHTHTNIKRLRAEVMQRRGGEFVAMGKLVELALEALARELGVDLDAKTPAQT